MEVSFNFVSILLCVDRCTKASDRKIHPHNMYNCPPSVRFSCLASFLRGRSTLRSCIAQLVSVYWMPVEFAGAGGISRTEYKSQSNADFNCSLQAGFKQ